MITVTDNFLDKEDFLNLKNVLMGSESMFPWFYNATVTTESDNSIHNFQFTHTFYNKYQPQSNYIKLLDPFIEKLPIRSLIRIKANLITKTENIIEHGFHRDFMYPESTTAVFYLNSNNGYTKFEDGSIVNSIENRFSMFNSCVSHTGSSCTDQQVRIVLNFNFF